MGLIRHVLMHVVWLCLDIIGVLASEVVVLENDVVRFLGLPSSCVRACVCVCVCAWDGHADAVSAEAQQEAEEPA